MSVQEQITNLKPTTMAIAQMAKKKIKVGKDGVCVIDADLYEKTLEGTGLDLATVKKVQQHNSELVSGLTLAVGELGINAMEKSSKIETVIADIPLGRDEVNIHILRSREVNDMKNPGQKMTQLGATTLSYTVRGTNNSGELKRVRQHLMTSAQALLASG